ncbi:DUF6440 family protein [Bacillus xiapuensis]|uniref:DUF6440 family protein n=1 Tax=Bacillus xiapuensis TaxID=2014075 RepID=A0ABU6N817_9BACI|nr:DUF6440 family protein [Bacillus xiapuensis]
MKKIISVVGLSVAALAGCGGNTEASKDSRFTLISSDSVDGYGIRVVKDKEKGCQYIITTGNGTSVFPLLEDGKPVCK